MATKKQLAALKKARAAKAKKKVGVYAKSQATGKRPNTRLKKRRKANKSGPKGYYPNPTSYIIEVTMVRAGVIGYLSDWTQKGPMVDTSAGKALKFPSRSLADKFAKAIYTLRPKGVRAVEVKTLGYVKKK